jgi:hypothetical protein
VFKVVFVTITLAIAWLTATCAALYYAFTKEDGSFGLALATNCLAALLLLVAAPVLFSLVLRKSRRYSVAVAIVAALLLVLAGQAHDALRDVLLHLGVGLWFVLAIDFNIVHRFEAWLETLRAEAKEAATDIRLVL